MRRLLLCTQPTDGGVGRHVGDVASQMSRAGWEVVLCAPSPPAGLHPGVRHVALEMGRAVHPAADAGAAARLARLVGEVEPTLVHAHSSKAGAIARLARLRRLGVPLVYTPHGYSFAGHFSRRGERRAYSLVERALAPLATRVVCVCEAEARLAHEIGPDSRVRVVHNGVTAPEEGPVDPLISGLARRGPVIGVLSQLRPGKGIETLIDALPHLLSLRPEAALAVCGDGSELDALRRRAADLGVEDAVHFVGRRSDVLSVLRSLDVFVHPSWAEAFPYVILEAMSVARPIVASAVGGVGEAIVDGESGLLVPPRDPRALADAITRLLESPDDRRRLGESARERALARFSLDTMIERLDRVYDELMGDPGRRSVTPRRSGLDSLAEHRSGVTSR